MSETLVRRGAGPEVSRRAVVAGAGAVALGTTLVVAGCSSSGSNAPTDSGSGGGASGGAVGAASEVPVGSAKIFDDQGIVVTQATAGSYAGFSTVCPHQGCSVARVEGASIECPCHGSRFNLDGSVAQGPATRGLSPKAVTVSGGQITVA